LCDRTHASDPVSGGVQVPHRKGGEQRLATAQVLKSRPIQGIAPAHVDREIGLTQALLGIRGVMSILRCTEVTQRAGHSGRAHLLWRCLQALERDQGTLKILPPPKSRRMDSEQSRWPSPEIDRKSTRLNSSHVA